MPRRKLQPHPFSDEWLEQIVKQLWESKAKGTKPVLSHLLQSLINAIMLKERDIFLKNHPENAANGFYHRNLTFPLQILTSRSLGSASEISSDQPTFLNPGFYPGKARFLPQTTP